MENSAASQQARPDRIRAMFDRIAPTYDLLNRVISFGLDTGWRREAIALFREFSGGAFLDIAAGSGDVSVEMASLSPRFTAGTDFSVNMLREYDRKMRPSASGGRYGVAACDALSLPFRECVFDGTITAFGIRNFADRGRSLSEMHRVLRPGGVAVILELSVPRNPVLKRLHALHSNCLLPVAGRIISGDASPTGISRVDRIVSRQPNLAMMRPRVCCAPALTFGAATIGRKP